MSTTQQQLQKLRNVYFKLNQMCKTSSQKINQQKNIFSEFGKILSKFASKLTELSKKINQQILSAHGYEETVLHHFQFMSNSLLKLAECSKKISVNEKQQVVQPLKLFANNYKTVSDQLLHKINESIVKLSQTNAELTKCKQNYYSSSEKFQKHRDMQEKIMSRIQSGDTSELQKFNASIKKLTESITHNQSFYLKTVQKINNQWKVAKQSVQQTMNSISHNQQTRISFSKRSVLSTLKFIQNFEKGFQTDIQTKINNSVKSVEKDQIQNRQQNKIKEMVYQILEVQELQEYKSYEDSIKKKRKMSVEEEEQSHLQQIFKKVKAQDKKMIKKLVQSWFNKYNENSISIPERNSSQQYNSPMSNKQKAQQKQKIAIDDIKGKIIQVLPYSFYFIQLFFNRVNLMSAFYLKLPDETFYYLLSTFNVVTKSLQLSGNTISQLNAQFIYKMIHISQRIRWRKQNKNNQNIELLSSHYCKTSKLFNEKKILLAIFNYIQKKKLQKKVTQEKKGSLNNIKSMFTGFTRKKQPSMNTDDHFNCLLQMTNIMANFSTSNQISLPFIKEILGNSNNQGTFDYLKGLILSKKDTEERRKIFFRSEIKQKGQKKMKKIIQQKKVAEYCILLTAQHGFLSKEELKIRLVSTFLKSVNHQILSHLKIQTKKKWIHLIPYEKHIDYIAMKQQVAQKSVPSATQEIITLDVNRSLHIHGQFLNPTVLHTLLRTYAYYHQQISYCQGMNYIAGFIYLKTLNEESAYRIFQYLMEIRFKELFVNQFQVLKVKMYQFQRLLSIFHPQISEHFKRQSISSQCYIVSWIITLFASSYQYTMESHLIDRLWQRFIIWGWRQFYRFVLWMFQLKKEQLIQLTYDKALHFLGQIARSKFLLSNPKQYSQLFSKLQDVDDGMDRYYVSEQLLQSLATEYKLLK